jgi:hypothetical protein
MLNKKQIIKEATIKMIINKEKVLELKENILLQILWARLLL